MTLLKTAALGTTYAFSLTIGAMTTGAAAQGFDPRANCQDVLQNATTQADQLMIAAWSFGYIAANTKNIRPVDLSNSTVMLKNIAKVCQENPQASLIALVNASASQTPEAAPAAAGSKADAEQLLRAFVQPGANHRALTQAVLPTEAEVKAVYAEPLASAMWASYREQMGPGVSFAPKAGQTDLLVTYATTRELFDRKPVLEEFPGGYKDVLQYFKVDVPIVRFKFVKPGETLGLAFDGLIYVNDRWVIMPKPWGAL
jgi:hypothetical protein